VCRGAWPLKALDVDCVAIPDAAMTLAVMALFADAPTRLSGIASWRVKETDRIAAMATELRKLGAQVEEGADWIRVHPPAAFRRARIRTYDDHRMAMCFALTALNAKVPVRIDDPACVAKTFPDYFETLFERVEAGEVPVIAIDGPTASGKGTLAHEVARELGYAGAGFRLAVPRRGAGGTARRRGLGRCRRRGSALPGPAAAIRGRPHPAGRRGCQRGAAPGSHRPGRLRRGGPPRGAPGPAPVAAVLPPRSGSGGRRPRHGRLWCFPTQNSRVFLTASPEARAERRHKQLISKGISTNIAGLLADLRRRDDQDRNRSTAPLKAASDAKELDNSALSIEESVQQVLAWWSEAQAFPG
jgi:3-phosphoshikimate 1-carboxyvinyltransferase